MSKKTKQVNKEIAIECLLGSDEIVEIEFVIGTLTRKDNLV